MARRRGAKSAPAAKRPTSRKRARPATRPARRRPARQPKAKAASSEVASPEGSPARRRAVAKAVAQPLVDARTATESSLDRLVGTLAESSEGVRREVNAIGRGLR